MRLAINLRVRFDLLSALPEDRVFQQIDIGLLAGSRVPFKLFPVSVCVRVFSLVSAFDAGFLDKFFLASSTLTVQVLEVCLAFVVSVSLQRTVSWVG